MVRNVINETNILFVIFRDTGTKITIENTRSNQGKEKYNPKRNLEKILVKNLCRSGNQGGVTGIRNDTLSRGAYRLTNPFSLRKHKKRILIFSQVRKLRNTGQS